MVGTGRLRKKKFIPQHWMQHCACGVLRENNEYNISKIHTKLTWLDFGHLEHGSMSREVVVLGHSCPVWENVSRRAVTIIFTTIEEADVGWCQPLQRRREVMGCARWWEEEQTKCSSDENFHVWISTWPRDVGVLTNLVLNHRDFQPSYLSPQRLEKCM
jgi:hypothetical protein